MNNGQNGRIAIRNYLVKSHNLNTEREIVQIPLLKVGVVITPLIIHMKFVIVIFLVKQQVNLIFKTSPWNTGSNTRSLDHLWEIPLFYTHTHNLKIVQSFGLRDTI